MFIKRLATISAYREVSSSTIDALIDGIKEFKAQTHHYRRHFFSLLDATEKYEAGLTESDVSRKSNCRKVYMCKNGCMPFYNCKERKCTKCSYAGDGEYYRFLPPPKLFCQLLYADPETAKIMKSEKTEENGFGNDIWDSELVRHLKETCIRETFG